MKVRNRRKNRVSVEEMLSSMLKENTGRSFLDSGGTPKYDENGNYLGSTGGYGRAYERNQLRDFENEKDAILSFRWNEIDVTINLYHWLKNRLSEYEEGLTEGLYSLANSDEYEYDSWLSCTVTWLEKLESQGREIKYGIYGEGTEPNWVNTYNEECLLSQTIQFLHFFIDDEEYVALQIHNGADVRGGYTSPRIFSLDNSCSELAIYDYQRATIYAGNTNNPDQKPLNGFSDHDLDNSHYWYTDDGYHWYFEGCCGMDCGTQLEDYDFVDDEDESGETSGKIYVDENGNGYSPINGALLRVSIL
jgi:hypothetical protein